MPDRMDNEMAHRLCVLDVVKTLPLDRAAGLRVLDDAREVYQTFVLDGGQLRLRLVGGESKPAALSILRRR